MAGPGQLPKRPGQKLTRPRTPPPISIPGEPAAAPELPSRSRLTADTLRWWETWATSPQASQFLETDWQRLMMLAELVDAYWRDPRPQLMAEIRLNEVMLGATVMDRRRLGWQTSGPEPATAPTAARADPRLSLVGDE